MELERVIMIIRLAVMWLALATVAVQAAELPSTPGPTSDPSSEPTSNPLFEFEGKRYVLTDLSARMQQLYGTVLQEHYNSIRTLVDEMLFDVYVEQLAAQQQRPVREVGMELLAVAEPTEGDVRNFYEQLRTRINLPFDQISARLSKELKRQRVLQHRAQLIARLKSTGKFALLLPIPPPVLAIIDTSGRPVRGQPSAPITIVEFGDFQCPNCKRAVSLIDDLLKKYPKDLKLVFMDLPINPSGISKQIAYGGVCAHNQSKFWAYHDAAFKAQATLSKDSPRKLAEQVDIALENFDLCMQDRGTRAKVQASVDEARRLGVNATPTLFVDGRPFPSNHLIEDLGAYIEKKKAEQD
jgi:protein-disulfide isomerase